MTDSRPQTLDRRDRLAAALLLAVAADVLMAVGAGFPLLRPFWDPWEGLGTGFLIVVLTAASMAVVLTPLLWLLLRSTARLRSRTSTMVVAVLPVAVFRLVRDQADAVLPIAILAAVLAGLRIFERSWPEPNRRTWRRLGATAVAMIALAMVEAARPPKLLGLAGEEPAPTVATANSPNLLIIMLDTTRADYLGTYGQERSTTPWIDRFALQATVFERAIAPSSYTLPSHASLFTGLYPESHGAKLDSQGMALADLGLDESRTSFRPLDQDIRTLAEIASENGLATGAVSANFGYLSPYFGLDQGFATWEVPRRGWYRSEPLGLSVVQAAVSGFLLPRAWKWWMESRIHGAARHYLLASEVNQLALRWLEGHRDKRFLYFVNYMDPHSPYLPTGEYRKLYSHADAPQDVARKRIAQGLGTNNDRERLPLLDAYAAEIRFVDDRLSELFDRFDDWGLLERTVVLIVGDHGESFGEHGELFHGTGLHEAQVHVPLILRTPGQQNPARVDRFVSLVDVMPTLLDLAGLDQPDDLQGRSLLRPGVDRPLPVAASLGALQRPWSYRAVYRDPWKLIVSSRNDVELYDLRADSNETNNLADQCPGTVRELVALRALYEQAALPRFGETSGEMEAETRRRLKSLGYLE